MVQKRLSSPEISTATTKLVHKPHTLSNFRLTKKFAKIASLVCSTSKKNFFLGIYELRSLPAARGMASKGTFWGGARGVFFWLCFVLDRGDRRRAPARGGNVEASK